MRINPSLLARACVVTGMLALAACASSGNESIKNETSTSIDQKIHDGSTTKEQIRAMFGDPMQTTFTDSGHEQWQYEFTNAQSDAANFIPLYGDLHQGMHGNAKHLNVIFSGDTVWHHSMNTSAVKNSAGLF